MGESPLTTKHVFSDPDAELIYRGLMLLVDAIRDLKAVILHDRDEYGRREPRD